MNENLLHIGALVLFVALCAAAGSPGMREQARHAAAQRAALIAAQQAARSQPVTRLAQLQPAADAASVRRNP